MVVDRSAITIAVAFHHQGLFKSLKRYLDNTGAPDRLFEVVPATFYVGAKSKPGPDSDRNVRPHAVMCTEELSRMQVSLRPTKASLASLPTSTNSTTLFEIRASRNRVAHREHREAQDSRLRGVSV